jgi:hypothetical protein
MKEENRFYIEEISVLSAKDDEYFDVRAWKQPPEIRISSGWAEKNMVWVRAVIIYSICRPMFLASLSVQNLLPWQ